MTAGRHRGESAQAVADRRYMAAHEALWRNAVAEQAAGVDYATDTCVTLAREESEASEAVRWWRQFVLHGRVMRKLAREGVEL